MFCFTLSRTKGTKYLWT